MVEIGQRFGNLVILEKIKKEDKKHSYFCCLCDCGKITIKRSDNLNEKSSCGCQTKFLRGHKKHGLWNTSLYNRYYKILDRCYNKNHKYYYNYGGRGITVCEEWLNDPISFYNWAINNGYKEGLSIDRIDNNGNYEPSNCRWVTRKEQERNKRNNKNFTWRGETHCIQEWCELLGFTRDCLYNRLVRAKWNIERALTTPQKQIKK